MDLTRKSYRQLLLMGIPMMATPIAYAAVFEFIHAQQQPAAGAYKAALGQFPLFILAGLFAVILAITPPLRRFLLRLRLKSVSTSFSRSSWPESVQTAYGSTMALLGLHHTPSVIGFLLSFFTGERLWLFLAAASSLALNAVFFPRFRHWHDWIEQSGGESSGL